MATLNSCHKTVATKRMNSCSKAFEDQKAMIMEEPMLWLPGHNMPFEIYTNATDFALEGPSLRGPSGGF